jgi:hypothetical protein
MLIMDVVVSEEAKELINIHGGVVYVRSHQHRCARGGPLTLLDITTDPPSDADEFRTVETDGITMRYHGDPVDQPHVLTIEVHGIVHRHMMAYWDGCAYKPE